MRVSEYGWTTQKVFHFLNFLVNGVRALVFVFGRSVQNLHPEVCHCLRHLAFYCMVEACERSHSASYSWLSSENNSCYGMDDEDDSVAKMKAAEEALEAKQKVTNSLSATCSFFFYHVL
ncbi:hypothetical protein E1A91_D07G197400v1 [Gossypium mustelinum]|uniref:THH1/TOM1/TOM3 domain-containing protein n=1 Tax=Gossypium mustelinum TaxID=34275 RepID=A0A5D2U9X0_GOSMU|nr:hypothetical protein E1A91_D07G197400v1 [Gossypium mustelinum]TYI74401.1 hypothetical protein E1A91_D07G197400v1 [Gossypium mustelinum]